MTTTLATLLENVGPFKDTIASVNSRLERLDACRPVAVWLDADGEMDLPPYVQAGSLLILADPTAPAFQVIGRIQAGGKFERSDEVSVPAGSLVFWRPQ